MDVISIKVNLIITVKDGFTGLPELKGRVTVKTQGGHYAEKRSGGCFVFIRCNEGLHRIIIESENYQTVSFDAVIGETPETVEVTLRPSRTYPFFGSVTKLFGRVAEGVGDIKAAFIASPSEARLQNSHKKGDSSIKMFLGRPVPESCTGLCLAQNGRAEVYKAVKDPDEVMTVTVDPPLIEDVTADAQVGFVYDVLPDENGEYFTAVRGKYSTALMIADGKVIEAELSDDESGTNIDLTGGK